MNVLLGISPRALSVCFTSAIGNVIPTFSVLSSWVVRFILVLYIVPCRAIYLSISCRYFCVYEILKSWIKPSVRFYLFPYLVYGSSLKRISHPL